MTEQEKTQLIKLRLQQAHEAADSAVLLLNNEFYSAALNRIYYGMFYCLLALALAHDFKTSKHGQIIGWFNREFIKTGRFKPALSKMLKEAFDRRTNADYELKSLPTPVEIEDMHRDMLSFIEAIETFLE